ncbi:MAG: hypothetical protein HYW57_05975 [Ignavibacteriales bacterium]|nr:hypothetical protein [Ignavibacteriales bacterium]
MKSLLLPLFLCAFLFGGCASLTLKPTDFGWPVESVLKVDGKGMVQEERYQLSFNVKPMLHEETGDSVNVSGITLRIIRDRAGYYYMTAPKFKHVYVFGTGEGSLTLESKIPISEKGMDTPAFNARPPHIQLLNGSDKPRLLSSGGILEGGKQ